MAAGSPEPFPIDRPESPRASVLVTGWRDAPHLLGCLRSLATTRSGVPFEVVVSLNEPTEELLASLDGLGGGLTVVSSPANAGFAAACNRGAAAARGALLVILNDDAVVEPGWLDALVATAEAQADAGAVGGKVLRPDGTVGEDGTLLWSDGSVTMLDDYHRPRPSPPPGVRQVDYASAASLLVRAEVLAEVGGFDEGYYPAYYEDVDLCLKIQATGRPVLYEPASVIRHRHGASAPLPYRLFLLARNRERLVARWPHVLSERPGPAPDDPRALGRAVVLAAERSVAGFAGPRLPDVVTADGPAGEAESRRRQAEVLAAYARSLEARLTEDEDRRRRRPAARLAAGLRRAGRHVPGARPAVVRIRRWAPGRRRGNPG